MTPHRSDHPTLFAARAMTTIAAMALSGAAACSNPSATAPLPTPPIPAFVYVADINGYQTLMRWDSGVVTQLTSGSNNYEPSSAGGRIVFTSTRDVMPQIYISDLTVTNLRPITNNNSFNITPSLSPSADSIAFASTRTGVPRIWITKAPALSAGSAGGLSVEATEMQLATGAPSWVPESAPSWSPVGSVIAFTSTRDGMSQVYLIPSGGGTATRITNEMLGAFQPSWSTDGTVLYYLASTPNLVMKRVVLSTGATTTIVDPDNDGDTEVGGPMSCNSSFCLLTSDPEEAGGSVLALATNATTPQVVFSRTAAMEREPAILRQ